MDIHSSDDSGETDMDIHSSDDSGETDMHNNDSLTMINVIN